MRTWTSPERHRRRAPAATRLGRVLGTVLALAAAGGATMAGGESKAPEAAKAPAKTETPAPAVTNPADLLDATSGYVHHWVTAPSFTAVRLPDGLPGTVTPAAGRAMVIVFLASWCQPCQQLMDQIERMAVKYRRLNTDVVYVFAHDTAEDASGFMREFNLGEGWLANHDILKAFHNPDLPTVYVVDRRGWLATRFVKADRAAVAELDNFLKHITAY